PVLIHLGNDNIAVAWGCPALHQQQVPGQDAGIFHRITRDFEEVRGLSVGDQILIEGHRICEFFLSRGGKASRDGAKHRQPSKESAREELACRIFVEKFLIEQVLNQEGNSMCGAKSSDGHQLAARWHTFPAPIECPNGVKMWM